MKVASVTLLVLSSLVDRADSQSFVCNFCPDGGIQRRDAVVVIPTVPDKTCAELETDANAFIIEEGQCPTLTTFAAPICCFGTAPTTSPPTVSPTESLAPTPTPTGKPSAAPSESLAPTFTSKPTATPTGSPTFPPLPECFTDLDDIRGRERAVYDTTVYREYILCPNTEFKLGRACGPGCLQGGSEPLSIRRNVGYKCGKEGLLSNNCKLIDGQFQIVSFDVQWEESQYEPHTNVTISGFQFEEGFFGTALLANRGSITFNNCVFRKQNTVGSIYALFDKRGLELQGRRLGGKVDAQHSLAAHLLDGGDYNQWRNEHRRTEEEQEALDRDLQVSNPDILLTLDVIFHNCVFAENEIARPGPFTQSAIITSEYPENRFEIYDTSFEGNKYNKPSVQGLGSAIDAAGPLTIKNSCFLNNEFLRFAPVVMISKFAVLTASDNYGDGIGDGNLECEFAIFFDNYVDFEKLQNFTCQEFDATECDKSDYYFPPVEVFEPTQAPSRTPRTFRPNGPTPDADTDADTADGRSIMFLSTAVAAMAVYVAL